MIFKLWIWFFNNSIGEKKKKSEPCFQQEWPAKHIGRQIKSIERSKYEPIMNLIINIILSSFVLYKQMLHDCKQQSQQHS